MWFPHGPVPVSAYVLCAPKTGVYKVGCSSNPLLRGQVIAGRLGEVVTLVAEIDGDGRAIERAVLRAFAPLRCRVASAGGVTYGVEFVRGGEFTAWLHSLPASCVRRRHFMPLYASERPNVVTPYRPVGAPRVVDTSALHSVARTARAA